jgi:hypothetical protein
MIRLIQLGDQRYHEGEITTDFAFLDTVTDTFITVDGEQVWDSRADFEVAAASLPEKLRARMLAKLPDVLGVLVIPCAPELAAKVARAAEVLEVSPATFAEGALALRVVAVAEGRETPLPRGGALVRPDAPNLRAALDAWSDAGPKPESRWTQQAPNHYTRDDGAVVWQIEATRHTPQLSGRWYADVDGLQSPPRATAAEAMADADAPPKPCSRGCGRDAMLGWPMCGTCSMRTP